jgi:hypothetical protein
MTGWEPAHDINEGVQNLYQWLVSSGMVKTQKKSVII